MFSTQTKHPSTTSISRQQDLKQQFLKQKLLFLLYHLIKLCSCKNQCFPFGRSNSSMHPYRTHHVSGQKRGRSRICTQYNRSSFSTHPNSHQNKQVTRKLNCLIIIRSLQILMRCRHYVAHFSAQASESLLESNTVLLEETHIHTPVPM